jgi:hypothetical protein
MEERKGRGGRGEERAWRTAQGRSEVGAEALAGRCPLATDTIATCATTDLLLKHPYKILYHTFKDR